MQQLIKEFAALIIVAINPSSVGDGDSKDVPLPIAIATLLICGSFVTLAIFAIVTSLF